MLCVSRLEPEKRVDLFVRAVAAARRSEPRVRGFVAGGGRERARVEALAAADPGVELLGERADVPALLAGADAFALTSEAEALPISILEAMALARPVLAPDLGGSSDAVVDGETGLLVPPGDAAAIERALLELARDPERARRMGEAGPRAPARALRRRGDGGRLPELARADGGAWLTCSCSRSAPRSAGAWPTRC